MRYRDIFEGNSPTELLIAAAIAAGVLLLVAAARLIARRKLRTAHATPTDVDDFLLDLSHRTKLFLLFLPAVFLGARALQLPADLRHLLKLTATLALIAQTALWTSGLLDYWLRRYRRTRAEDPAAAMTVNVFRIAAIVTVWILAALVAIEYLGFNVTTLIAGLGIGGVAVALATQNILADLFASLSIVIDKPFVLGDSIAVDAQSGTVEHIGLKTTRLRASSGEEVIFANGDLLRSRIRNFRRMTERRALFRITVDPATDTAKLARVPLLLRAAVEKQKSTRFERAHLVAIDGSGFEFELAYFVLSPAYGLFLDVQQAVLLDLVGAFAAESIALARSPAPART
ncbi:MAG: mechanosensitive ion channel family protein [Acidobacteria bacterium]|nr:mechanosensitive ion channel family protein [Acidobacteriota bacterium]MBV9477906.1 mechanosensitive ion channel family protein [Acidobacteriota bacterium]